ncbi:cupin domain-containing protein [Nonlabens sp.]|uniref:cupin domain-containing protein n=1 Tax=Nonlabens sp. TaxID=1888209 RepID=UPI001BCB2693|nr:cupin domain-containing protein [Nonlabens sp.]
MPQVYLNPVTKEKASILKTSAQTHGAYILIEVVLQPGGGNPIHFHKRFTEDFYPLQGTLGVHYLGEELFLRPGMQFKIPLLDAHRFYNPGDQTIVFRAKLEPGQPGFENFIAVLFGFVGDGTTFGKKQVPFHPLHAVLLLHWVDNQVDHFLFRCIKPLLSVLVTLSRKLGYEKHLLQKYKSL